VKWSYSEVLGDKILGVLDCIVTTSFGYILYCNLYSDCCNLFCNVWVCIGVGFVMYVCVCVCVCVEVGGCNVWVFW
jgi:hypothetical protein